jgi:hypothetical protein
MSFLDNMKSTVGPAIFGALGDSSTFTPSGGAAVSCTVIITFNVMLQPTGVESQVWQGGTTIEALLSEITNEPNRGDVFVAGGVSYTVQTVLENDGVSVKVVVT